MAKIFPNTGSTSRRWWRKTLYASRRKFSYVAHSEFIERWKLQETLGGYSRRFWINIAGYKLTASVRAEVWAAKAGRLALTLAATLLSILVIGFLLWFGDFSSSTKVSETSLAAAQIIGAALALVLSLSIIPAQRASELFAGSILTFFANDRTLRFAFLVLVCTTLASLLLGTSWYSDLNAKVSLSIQFILLGVSFDALRLFYTSTLALLAPDSAIKRLVKEIRRHLKSAGRTADKLVSFQIATAGVSDSLEKQAHAAAIAARRLPERLQYWTSQLEESGHKFVSRRDSNAAIEVLGALECIACEYAELRKKSVTLHLDARFFLSGPQSDISDVLNPVYETLLRITDDAISSKNERVAQHCIDGMGRMAVHAMSVHAARTHGQPIAPLAFAAVYYLGRAARAVLAANMQDAILHAIRALTRVLLSRPSDIDLTGIAETVNNSLFEIASDGEVKRNGAAVFRSVEAMLQSVKFEIARETFDYDSFASTLHQLFRLFPMEVIADSAGLRHLQVFPPYHLGFHASIPMLLQDIAQKVQLDPERPWLDPFHDLSKAMEGVRDHYRALTQIDFGHTLLHKHTIESLGAVLRVLFNQITCPPKGTGEHVQTVVHDLLQQISWMSGFFPDHAKEYRHVSDATACLTILGLDALDHDQSVIAEACVSALSKIAIKVGAKQGSWELADVHRDMEIFARAVGMKKDMKLAARVRSMMTMPLGLTPEMDKLYFEAQQTRFLQLDEALARAGRRPYMIRIDPVERLYEILNRRTDIDEPEDQS